MHLNCLRWWTLNRGGGTADAHHRQLFFLERNTATAKMAKFFTPVQINEFKECFSLYDKKQKGKIVVKDLITVMRCLGTSPTFGEIERHLQVHKIEKSGELDFSTFLTMMHRQMQQEDPKTEILEALRMTDKQKKGYIQASELRAKLTMLGEKLTNKEVDELFKEANVKSNGTVNYEEFTQMVTLPPVDY
ncbi:calmodulin-like protein 4a isoform X2 [Anarrhichthys ocellatus]|uniref:calmodulin-like protein 4a isoform X2 n=1 Tax=Anarrhichthys ocellatus TaxID=433405 RepID=UPI0012EE1AC2|nr:calmodulin-like protein 4 isoform X2 [Anarrhichthys ocellatus]